MGKSLEADNGEKDRMGACVDNQFRVFGVQRLRVVDLSVVPMMIR